MVNQKIEHCGIEGVDPAVFKPGFDGELVGASGRPLIMICSDFGITVRDKRNHLLRLIAWHSDYGEDQTFSVDVHTKASYFPQGKHPDMYAKRFVRFALDFFQSFGHPISFYKSQWEKSSDNYSQWEFAKNAGLNPVEALEATWAGKLRHDLGFTQLVSYQLTDRPVQAVISTVSR